MSPNDWLRLIVPVINNGLLLISSYHLTIANNCNSSTQNKRQYIGSLPRLSWELVSASESCNDFIHMANHSSMPITEPMRQSFYASLINVKSNTKIQIKQSVKKISLTISYEILLEYIFLK